MTPSRMRIDPRAGGATPPKFVAMGSGWHATTGSRAIFWRTGDVAKGNYTVDATFTLSKRRSWSPRSYNMLALAGELPGARVLRCELQDEGYDRSGLTFGVHRTGKVDKPIKLFFKRTVFRRVALDQTRGDPGALAQLFLAVEKAP